jgi:uncharacterized membrane protein YphA (DoxX/SURF4 family)
MPALEIILGGFLLAGYYTRLAALMTIPIILVAIYLHLIVINPTAFPSQPQAPVIPSVVDMMAYYLLLKGGVN